MSIYEIPPRDLPLRQRHHNEQMQLKMQQQSGTLSSVSVEALSISTGTSTEDFTVPGVEVGDSPVLVGDPGMPITLKVIRSSVPVDGTVRVQLDSDGTSNVPAGIYKFQVFR